ncbi:serine protease [Pseudomonas sp. R5(2019)]|nr:serine protease [Pseudomonas sp. R5(2019)]NBA98624.1 serine protease [Pseudomonas sp. R5(2019)]
MVKPEIVGSASDSWFPVHSGFPLPYVFLASAVQWNEDYAVTAGHIPFITYVQHACSTGCDLVFFKHKARGRIPNWRAPKPGESITAAGSSPYLASAVGRGRVYSTPFFNTNDNSGDRYAIHDAPLIKGMSGGPVIAADGSVLGINIGYHNITAEEQSKHPGIKDAQRISVFLPYAVIQREWVILQAKLNMPKRSKYAVK